jgi:serine/threonine protein phosphatase PrpC
MICSRCGAEAAPGDRFCADCGARIAAPEPPAAGGYAETVGPGLAARTDPGLVHRSNQDAFALSGAGSADGDRILVLCDGVSNSQTPALASATAARVAHAVLAAAQGGQIARADAMRDAIRHAHEAVCALPFDRQAELDPPATTIVAAWLHPAGVTIGWLGDSRAYSLTGAGGQLLTRDHSWLQMVVERGEMTLAEARRDHRAHALVHCLGTTDFAKASPCPTPGIADCAPGEGWLLLCSDGLWNYAETAAAVARAAGEGLRGDAADLCARLVAFALANGGHDNVTVMAARWR